MREAALGQYGKERIDDMYYLADRQGRSSTIVSVGGVSIGNGSFVLIGGPCAVEDRDQLLSTAKAVRSGCGSALRGGVFKTRTSPYAFQGLGKEGLDYMSEARECFGLPLVVEALCEDHVVALESCVDMIQIGARNMQNVPLLRRTARSGLPILLKRGPAATLDELLCAAEYILQDNPNVVLCERGIRGFDRHTRYVFDLAGALRLKELSHLPVIVDPSHAAGRRSLVEPLTLAAAAAGLDGAIIEVHPRPDAALSDSAQSIDCATFERIAARVGLQPTFT